MNKLQLLSFSAETIRVDEAPAHRPRVQNHVSGNSNQDVPIISRVGETTHGNAKNQSKQETFELDTSSEITEIWSMRTSCVSDCVIQFCRTVTDQSAFSVKTNNQWNALPDDEELQLFESFQI